MGTGHKGSGRALTFAREKDASSELGATVIEFDPTTEPGATVIELDPATEPGATVVETDPVTALHTARNLRDAIVSPVPERRVRVSESRDADSRKITAATPRVPESVPPTPELGSNPEPTVATKLDPGVTNLVAGTLVGEYVIERLLGAGAMGQVYGGLHEQLGKRVAIKVIAPSMSRDRDAIERFQQEALALARLSHPNIVGVLSIGTLPGDGRAFYVMEWLDGEALQARLDRGRPTLDEALDILDQIARGLEAANGSGIVHRDLKPDNVWLQRFGDEARPTVKILDFGLAKLARHRRSEQTAANVMFGTPQYMSPEQCRSARDVGPATDVYALGCVMFELLCGRLPFIYDNVAELTVAHLSEEPPHPRDLNPAIDRQLGALLFAMLAKDPAHRPTLVEVRKTIAHARKQLALDPPRVQIPRVSSSTITAPQVVSKARAVSSHPSAPAGRSPRMVVVAAVAALMLLLTIVVIASSETPSHGVVEQATVPRTDAADTKTNPPTPVDIPAVTVNPPINPPPPVELPVDAVVQERGRPHNPHRADVPHVDDGPHAHVDAAVADVNAEVADTVQVDAGDVDSGSRKPSVPKVPEPQLRRPIPPAPPLAPPPSSPVQKKPKLDKNKTFNPFTKQPADR